MSRFETVLCIAMVVAVILVFWVQAFRPSPQPGIPVPAIPTAATGATISVGTVASGKSVEARTGAPETPPDGAPTSTAHPPSETAVTARAAARVTVGGSHSISGVSTWYRWRIGQAAAGPRLRAAIGPRWRGTVVVVSTATHRVRVRLTDFCGCSWARVIDLDSRSFRALGPLSRGVLRVRVSW